MNLSTEKFFANKRSDKYSQDSNFKNTFIGKKLADNLITDNFQKFVNGNSIYVLRMANPPDD